LESPRNIDHAAMRAPRDAKTWARQFIKKNEARHWAGLRVLLESDVA
jgi:hypothetical protein